MKYKHEINDIINDSNNKAKKNRKKRVSRKYNGTRHGEDYQVPTQLTYGDLPYKRKGKVKLVLFFAFFVLAIVAVIFAGKYKFQMKAYTVNDSYAMGTHIDLTVYGKDGQSAVDTAFSNILMLENTISSDNVNSEISKIGKCAGFEAVKISQNTMDILKSAKELSELTGGMYDITVLPIENMWDFNQGAYPYVPDEEQIKLMLEYTGYQQLILDETNMTAYLPKQICGIQLNSANKGAACDSAISSYKNSGISSAMVRAGASIGVLGSKPGGSDWNIDLSDPAQQSQNSSSVLGTLNLKNSFVSTVGTYERYFERDGKTYHHILNPKTGYPVENDLLSVSVICDSGTMSDMLSTACFTVGMQESKKLLDKYNAQAIFVDKNNNVYVTSGIKDNFSLSNPSYTLCDYS